MPEAGRHTWAQLLWACGQRDGTGHMLGSAQSPLGMHRVSGQLWGGRKPGHSRVIEHCLERDVWPRKERETLLTPDSELITRVFTEHLLCAKHYFNHSSGSMSFTLSKRKQEQRLGDFPTQLRFISRQLNSYRMLALMLYIHQHFSMLF